MTVVETVLVFLIIPLALLLVVAGLVMGPALRNRDRYKPGKPWGHPPVWYEPHPVGGVHHDEDDDHRPALTPGARAGALAIGQAPHTEATPIPRTASGGARGTW